MRKLILLLCLLVSVVAEGRKIPESEAAAIASKFLNSAPTKQQSPKKVVRRVQGRNSIQEDFAPYYVYNADADNGFVIVSGDDRATRILGYSNTGVFDFNNLPPQLSDLLDQYAKQINAIPADAPTHSSWRVPTQSSSSDGGVLLETAEWNQFGPYNASCPEIDGIKPPTGCTNTAQAILMKYHEWPLQGKGSVNYSWNGKYLSANLSESTYDWGKMKNQYKDNGQSLSEEEINAVATLFRDISYANHTDFNFAGSGAGYNISALVNNFLYAPKYCYLSRRGMTIDKLFSAIKSELDNGRPCLVVSATTPAGAIAHAYVCDGYDANRYLHFNFGWGGSENGFYSLEPVNYFPSYDIEFYGGIEPNRGNISEDDCLVLSAFSWDDFTFDGKDIQCNLYFRSGFFNRVITTGIAFGNIMDNSKIITEISSCDWTEGGSVQLIDVDMLKENTLLEDGDYIIFPVVKIEGTDWREFDFNEYYQNQISLTVKNGAWNFRNIPNIGSLDDGKVEIDNIYYILDHDTHNATVTNRNSATKCYSGNVMIPQTVEFDGEHYTVNRIGYNAMNGCVIDSLILPETIEVIESGGLLGAIHWINLSELTSLKVIEGWGITSDMPDISLPENLESVENQSVGFSNVDFLNLPASLKSIGHMAFLNCTKLENIQFNCSDQEAIKSIGGYEMLDYIPLRNMYVPKGTKTFYESHLDFGKYHIREGQYQNLPGIDRSVSIDGINYIFIPETKTAKVTYPSYPSGQSKHFTNIKIPSSLWFENEQYSVTEVDAIGFCELTADTLCLPKTIEKIGWRGLDNVQAKKINFEELPHLIVIDSWGCNNAVQSSNRLILPSNLQTIGEMSFGCCSFPRVVLPRSLKNIGPRAFAYNWELETILASWTTAEEIQEICSPDVFDECSNLKGIIVPAGCKELYKIVEPWCSYSIFDKLVESLTIDPESWSGNEGDAFQIMADVLPENATDKTIIWTSSDESVATVDAEGMVTVLKVGSCVITASTVDGSDITAECIITCATAIENLFADNMKVDVYTTGGVLLKRNYGKKELKTLTPGVYILRNDSGSKTVVIY